METTTTPTPIEFLNSMRGRFIVAQALHYGIKSLESVEGVMREKSNISDMKFLQEELFNFPKEVFENEHTHKL